MTITQEQRDLLIKDLCARLPYGVKIQTPTNCWSSEEGICELKEIFKGDDGLFRIGDVGALIEYSKPYLFPMSSMTEEQKKEWQSLMISDSFGILYHTIDSFDYLYKNHIDCRGFIPKGWANDATGKNIY